MDSAKSTRNFEQFEWKMDVCTGTAQPTIEQKQRNRRKKYFFNPFFFFFSFPPFPASSPFLCAVSTTTFSLRPCSFAASLFLLLHPKQFGNLWRQWCLWGDDRRRWCGGERRCRGRHSSRSA